MRMWIADTPTFFVLFLSNLLFLVCIVQYFIIALLAALKLLLKGWGKPLAMYKTFLCLSTGCLLVRMFCTSTAPALLYLTAGPFTATWVYRIEFPRKDECSMIGAWVEIVRREACTAPRRAPNPKEWEYLMWGLMYLLTTHYVLLL